MKCASLKPFTEYQVVSEYYACTGYPIRPYAFPLFPCKTVINCLTKFISLLFSLFIHRKAKRNRGIDISLLFALCSGVHRGRG